MLSGVHKLLRSLHLHRKKYPRDTGTPSLSSVGATLIPNRRANTNVPEGRFLSLPTELIFAVLLCLDVASVFSFARMCRRCYALALPVLNRTVIITHHNFPKFQQLLLSEDITRIASIRRIQIGRLDRIGHAERWNLVDILNFLSQIPNMRELETRGGTFVAGWNGLDGVGRVLGERLQKMEVKMFLPFGITDNHTTFVSLRTLRIRITPYAPQPLNMVLRSIHTRCPAIADLSLVFQLIPGYVHEFYIEFRGLFDSNVFFRSLEAFSLTLRFKTQPSLPDPELDGLYNFLQRHARTLRELTLPAWLPRRHIPDQPSLQLRYLRTGLALAEQLAPLEYDKHTLKELYLEDLIPIRTPTARHWYHLDVAEKFWPFRSVQVLTIAPERETIFEYQFMPKYSPELQALHLVFVKLHVVARDLQNWESQKREVLFRATKLREVTLQVKERWRQEYKVIRGPGRAKDVGLVLDTTRRVPCDDWYGGYWA